MKKIYLFIIIVMFLLFIQSVNAVDLGCCVKRVDDVYCQVTEENTGECDENSAWYSGKLDDFNMVCSGDVSECEVGCCVIDGRGIPNFLRAQCDDQKKENSNDRFIPDLKGECPAVNINKIACIKDRECIFGWTSERCGIEGGVVDGAIKDKSSCDDKTREEEANKGCCKTSCSYVYRYECDGSEEDFIKGDSCEDIIESCPNCNWMNSECRNKDEKEIMGEKIQRGSCGGIKSLGYCGSGEYCENGECKNANCGDKEHLERWCVKQGIEPGNRHSWEMCEFGVINPTFCGEYRDDVCKDSEDEMAPEQSFEGAKCYDNVWPSCFDYKGNEEDECRAKGDCGLVDGKCLPLYPPGLQFWKCSGKEDCKSKIFGNEPGQWNDKMCSVNTNEDGCKRSGDCEIGEGFGSSISKELDCGYGCCWYTHARGRTGSIEKRCDEDFDESILCVTDYTLKIPIVRRFTNIPDCPRVIEIIGENYCKGSDGRLCKTN